MKVLVVVAHPDDEVLGCGATIAKLASHKHAVTVLLPTSRSDARGRQHWSALLDGFRAATSRLGATSALPEKQLDETLAEPNVHHLADIVQPWVEKADLVLTHWPGDVNQVHRGVARAVEIATRPFRRRRDVSLFEIPTSTDQVFGAASLPFQPTEFVVVEQAHARAKMSAMELYPTELAPGRTPEDVERRMRQRGAEIGVEYAEAFVVARRFA